MWKEIKTLGGDVLAHSSKWVSVNIQLQALDISQGSASTEKKRWMYVSPCVVSQIRPLKPSHIHPCKISEWLHLAILGVGGWDREIHVMVGKHDVFYLRDVWFYYYKGRAATEFVGVCDILLPCGYTIGAPRVPLL